MTTPHYQDDLVTVHHGDCLDVMRTLPGASVDAIVTDPPYGLGFMGKAWDDLPPGREWAEQCLRVLKPGGHLLAFGGSRTWHRLAVAVEDAGFEIRDSIAWLTGSGFPKSRNVSKDPGFCQCEMGELGRADDQVCGVREDVSRPAPDAAPGGIADLFPSVQREGARAGMGDARPQGGSGPEDVHAAVRGRESSMEGRRDAQTPARQLPGSPVRPLSCGVVVDGAGGRLHNGTPASDGSVDRPTAAAIRGGEPQGSQPFEQHPVESRVVSVERGSQAGRGRQVCGRCGKPSIPSGLGTALKPAFEPVVVGRKPLTGTVAVNVLAHGTGALNIDACRTAGATRQHSAPRGMGYHDGGAGDAGSVPVVVSDAGRWPTNVVFDDTQAAELDQQSGVSISAVRQPTGRDTRGTPNGSTPVTRFHDTQERGVADSGGASRFFPTFRYEAKAPASERPTVDGIAHPTVKPLDLMRWLVRLVTPRGGVVLDPFAGSGTTAEACILEHFRCITIEREAEHLPLIVARLSKPLQAGFDFGEETACRKATP